MPFPEMRRKRQALDNIECEEILAGCNTGFLGVSGSDGYPYVVPLNFVYWNDCIYFHCSSKGHKIDAIKTDPKVSFCVVERDEVLVDEFATAYRSVIAFGNAFIVEDIDEKRSSLKAFGLKYNPDESAVDAEIAPSFERTTMVRIRIDHMTGKQALSLLE